MFSFKWCILLNFIFNFQPEPVVYPKHFAVFHLEVLAGQNPGILDGSIWVLTEFETIKIKTGFEVQHGSLIVEPQPIVFNNCFPVSIYLFFLHLLFIFRFKWIR